MCVCVCEREREREKETEREKSVVTKSVIKLKAYYIAFLFLEALEARFRGARLPSYSPTVDSPLMSEGVSFSSSWIDVVFTAFPSRYKPMKIRV